MRLKFLEILLHGLVFGPKAFDWVVWRLELLNLGGRAVGREGIKRLAFVVLSSFFAKLRDLFIFG